MKGSTLARNAEHAKPHEVLLLAAEAAGFQVIITADHPEIPLQQNLTGRMIAIVILCPATDRLAALRESIPDALRALDEIQLGQIIRISPSPS